nr:hypothetical protein [Actinomadura madurae]
MRSTRPATAAPGEKGRQRGDRAGHGQPRPAYGRHAEDDDVARHVAGEHLVEAEVSDGVDDARREGEREHETQWRDTPPRRPAAGVGAGRDAAHRPAA